MASAARVLAGLCLLVPIVVMMWVPSYSKVTPKLGGMPFFYWYQLLWVLLSALFTGTAYLLIRRDEAARRAAAAAPAATAPAADAPVADAPVVPAPKDGGRS
ncbi:DUF3311 domain-containing protein [Kitasatospora phosalacinea]|uniref:DUF3311 domain-containing protein n=1 Tax=Kitasatospora phosalacinea TaxID=2065 RepID=A0ABW6GFT2_9ACTN